VTVKHLAERFSPSLVTGEARRLPHSLATSIATMALPSRPRRRLEALLGLSDKRIFSCFAIC